MDTEKVLQSAGERLMEALSELQAIPGADINIFNVIADLECVAKKVKRIAEIYHSL